MALAIVQTTPRVRATNSLTVANTLTTPPTVGNALIVPVALYQASSVISPATLTCADNRGNTYTRALLAIDGAQASAIFFCPKLTVATAPFIVTLTQTAVSFFETAAVEVSGVGAALAIDQVVTNTPHLLTTAPTTTATAPLTSGTALLVSVLSAIQNQTTITVESVTPVWVEVLENISYTASIACEADQRIATGLVGATPACAWTLSAAAFCTAGLVAFAGGPAPPSGGGNIKAKLGNKHGKTNEHGAVVVVPGPAGSGVGTPAPFPNLPGPDTDTDAVQVASVTAGALRSPYAALENLRVTTDDQGSLRVASVTAGVLGPLTLLRNVRCRTDETGALLVTSGPAGSLTSPASPLLNLRARSDDQGALVVTGLTAPLTYQQLIVADGASVYWPLDDPTGPTARDLIGTRHGTVTGGVTINQPGIGTSKAMDFNGSTGYISLPQLPAIFPACSWEAWIYLRSNPDNAVVLQRGAADVVGCLVFSVTVGATPTLRFDPYPITPAATSTATITLAAWQYVVWTGDGTTVRFYVNGVLSNSLAATLVGDGAAIPTNRIGTYVHTPGGWFTGLMQDVAIYPRALTASEISAHYARRLAP